MKRPWMPLYIADYLHDTAHLRAAESGAYLHLIMSYWTAGRLPNDDRQLATIAKMTDQEWRRARPTIEAFFSPGFTAHKRIDAEIAKSAEVSSKRRAAALQRYCNQPANAGANAPTLHTSHSTIVDGGGDARPAEFLLAVEIGKISGYASEHEWPSGWFGAPMRVRGWLDNGWRPAVILVAVREAMAKKRDGPPSSVKYFEKAIARAHALDADPLPTATVIPMENVHVQQRRDPLAGAFAEIRAGFDGSGETPAADTAVRDDAGRGAVEILPPSQAGRS